MSIEHTAVFVTVAERNEAEKIARCLLEDKLIACANIIGPAHSLFSWQGRIEEATEYLLVMKTRTDLFERLSERVKALHSYDVPEIVALPIISGYKAYLNWIDNSVR